MLALLKHQQNSQQGGLCGCQVPPLPPRSPTCENRVTGTVYVGHRLSDSWEKPGVAHPHLGLGLSVPCRAAAHAVNPSPL